MPLPTDPAALSDPTSLGRLLSELESGPQQAEAILAQLPDAPPAQRIGFTGSPGVGKSTLVNQLIGRLCDSGERVAVIAVDPTSAVSGGAVLGDRVRLSNSGGRDVFIRSMASRGSLGGITPAASATARVLEAAGYTAVLIETVGVGQTGYDIISLADTVVALFSPESGDGIQLLKAGIMEIGDIYVVNKCDRPGADLLAAEIRNSLDLSAAPAGHHRGAAANTDTTQGNSAGEWEPPVLQASARDGQGIDELVTAMGGHHAWLQSLPPDHPARLRRTRRELQFVVATELALSTASVSADLLDSLAKGVAAGTTSRHDALSTLRLAVRKHLSATWPD